MECLVANQLLHQLLVFHGHAAGNQPVQHVHHLFFHECPALQQDFAQGQCLAVGQLHLAELFHTVALAVPVIVDGIDISRILRLQLQEIADIVDISLDAPLIHPVSLRFLRSIHCLSVDKLCIDSQHPFYLAVSSVLRPVFFKISHLYPSSLSYCMPLSLYLTSLYGTTDNPTYFLYLGTAQSPIAVFYIFLYYI